MMIYSIIEKKHIQFDTQQAIRHISNKKESKQI